MFKFLLLSTVFSFVAKVNAYNCESHDLNNICTENSDGTCEKCLQAHPCCAWCFQATFNETRCNTKENLVKAGCSIDTINYEVSTLAVVQEKDYSVILEAGKDEPAIQMKPQKVKVKLKPRDSVSFQLKYKPAENYPLDLYFLMDISYTMKDHLEAVAELGETLPGFLKNLTSTFQLALGLYMDKISMPFYYMDRNHFENPCFETEANTCQKGFDFKHVLNFTNKVEEFIDIIDNSKVSANVDDLEGGFDALMQVLVCEEEMKWRKHSRKIVVIATDGLMHSAGDGLLSGTIKKNPGVCNLDKEGNYVGALDYDYPSLEELYLKLLEKKTNVLFVLRHKIVENFYKELNFKLPDITSYKLLTENSSNSVLKVISDGYTNVVKNLKFSSKSNLENSPITVTAFSHCNKDELYETWNKTFSCDNVEIGKEYIFNITLEMKDVPQNGIQGEIIKIEELNIKEDLQIEVEYFAIECQCEDDDPELHKKCQNGEFKCGKCNCQYGW